MPWSLGLASQSPVLCPLCQPMPTGLDTLYSYFTAIYLVLAAVLPLAFAHSLVLPGHLLFHQQNLIKSLRALCWVTGYPNVS